MDIAFKDAEGRWDELIERAEQGEEIVITRDGQSVAKLGPVGVRPTEAAPRKLDRALIDEITRQAVAKIGRNDGPPGDHSFLYDDNGLPI